ncbi:restriction endonuclease [uncultured Chryseobacterium sp.]|uniref:nSTAND1 domain-containing NTPase n=1 Tax=uncultured Chryseobacterium sp. TaxID=259322 RepID=UPI0025D31EF7|nr:restriction endonuclease [uncultured Chryseobacterium sp.]
MKTEIKVILDENSSNKAKGNCFEDLVRNLLSINQYEIKQNINFAGLEIDLIAEHKHNGEKLYVECKAKEKVTSDELSKFAFNVSHKRIDKGYFFRSQELQSQAGALLIEMREDERYKNLTFFEPKDMIQMLSDGKLIYEPLDKLAHYSISKKILAVTFLGDYFIYLVNESSALPTKYIIINARRNNERIERETINLLQSKINEISNLELISKIENYTKQESNLNSSIPIETISEVQESENWFDYKPASSAKHHFVGRDEIRTNILQYFKEIRQNKTSKRIFYLNGKSGWGKSSLVLELKGRCLNKHFRNSFFAIAIDTRSANSENFVALSFKKLINQAIESKFIDLDLSYRNKLEFTSIVDLLSSESIISVLDKLKSENKFLVLIFDQFEDVFRKKDFFKTFYKFLTDVTDTKPNLIIGFSWKSDFFLQSEDPSYHIWQQAKEQAREFTITEFGEKEIDAIIKQLEDSVGHLNKSIKDRIKESSQGLPWLTKKLCIHILDQIHLGTAKNDLLESNLNIQGLFKKDEERLNGKELKAINLIAKRAFDGNFFDETEVGELIDNNTIADLINKRLIIRSGSNYNIYWDIYRDYLVTGKIPVIGESYLLRQGVNLCFEVFQLLEQNKPESLENILKKHHRGITQDTLSNILMELRNLGLVQKIDEKYIINPEISTSKEGFIDYITNKFQNYTPYLVLNKLKSNKINKIDVIQVLKNNFKQDFQENTWDSYAKHLISWFLFSNLDIKSRLIEPTRGRGNGSKLNLQNKEDLLPKISIKEFVEIIPLLDDIGNISSKFKRELLIFDIIDNEKKLTKFGQKLFKLDSDLYVDLLRKRMLILPKMITLNSIIEKNPKIKAKELIKLLPRDFFGGEKESSKIIYATKVITWFKKQ